MLFIKKEVQLEDWIIQEIGADLIHPSTVTGNDYYLVAIQEFIKRKTFKGSLGAFMIYIYVYVICMYLNNHTKLKFSDLSVIRSEA